MPRRKDATISVAARTGQKTAKLAAEILCDTNTGFRIPTAREREAIEVNFIGGDPAILSLLDARPGMPDPRPQRPVVDAMLRRLEAR